MKQVAKIYMDTSNEIGASSPYLQDWGERGDAHTPNHRYNCPQATVCLWRSEDNCESLSSPRTIWVQEMELRSSDLTMNPQSHLHSSDYKFFKVIPV